MMCVHLPKSDTEVAPKQVSPSQTSGNRHETREDLCSPTGSSALCRLQLNRCSGWCGRRRGTQW